MRRDRQGASRRSANAVTWHTADLLDHSAAADLVASVRPTDLLHLAWYAYLDSSGRRTSTPTGCEPLRLSSTPSSPMAANASWAQAAVPNTTGPPEPVMSSRLPFSRVRATVPQRLRRADTCSIVVHDWHAAAHGGGCSSCTVQMSIRPASSRASSVRCLREIRPRARKSRQRRDFLDVRDVAAGFVQLLDSSVTGAVNVAPASRLQLAIWPSGRLRRRAVPSCCGGAHSRQERTNHT